MRVGGSPESASVTPAHLLACSQRTHPVVLGQSPRLPVLRFGQYDRIQHHCGQRQQHDKARYYETFADMPLCTREPSGPTHRGGTQDYDCEDGGRGKRIKHPYDIGCYYCDQYCTL